MGRHLQPWRQLLLSTKAWKSLKSSGPESSFHHVGRKRGAAIEEDRAICAEASWSLPTAGSAAGATDASDKVKERRCSTGCAARMCRPEGRLTPGTGDLGLGLAICKRLLETRGGLIYIEGELRKGATFRFTLPLHGEEG